MALKVVSRQKIPKKFAVSKVPFSNRYRLKSNFSKNYSVLGHCGHCTDAGPGKSETAKDIDLNFSAFVYHMSRVN